jgi:hypothetical protein
MTLLQLPLPCRIWLRWQGCLAAQLQRLRSREVADVLTALAVAQCGKVDPRWVGDACCERLRCSCCCHQSHSRYMRTCMWFVYVCMCMAVVIWPFVAALAGLHWGAAAAAAVTRGGFADSASCSMVQQSGS